MTCQLIWTAINDSIEIVIWPITFLTTVLVFNKPIRDFLSRLTKAELPGVITLEALKQEVSNAKIASEIVKGEPKTLKGRTLYNSKMDPNAKMISLGLRPSPSNLNMSFYTDLIEQDANVALAGLRTDLEIMLKNLAQGFQTRVEKKDSLLSIATKLKSNNSITSGQFTLIRSIINVCNYAIHGERISKEQALDIIESTETLISSYLAWLNWGFKPKGKQ